MIARGRSTVTGRRSTSRSASTARRRGTVGPWVASVACSTFHHFADMNWDTDAGAPSFVTDRSRRRDRSVTRHASTIFKDYVHNIARWLAVGADEANERATASEAIGAR